MAERRVTQLQVSGHRFTRRRLEHALWHGTTAVGSPARPFAAGVVLSVLIAIGCVVLSQLRPPPVLGDAPIVVARESGALYVRVGQTWHPVLNLASARLIAAADISPHLVAESAIVEAARGPLLGIPGAPQTLGPPLSAEESTWTVCDNGAEATAGGPRTTIIVGPLAAQSAVAPLAPENTVLVTTSAVAPTFLVRDGQRALVDLTDSRVVQALHLVGVAPRSVSAVLVNTLPEAPPLTVGSVSDGGEPAVPAVPAVLSGTGTLCVSWFHDQITLRAGAGLPLPPGQVPVGLAQADGIGPALDAVHLPAGRSVYARCDGWTGNTRYLVADTGVRFAVGDDDAAGDLGMPAQPTSGPCPMLAALPAGPALTRANAAIARDTIAIGSGSP